MDSSTNFTGSFRLEIHGKVFVVPGRELLTQLTAAPELRLHVAVQQHALAILRSWEPEGANRGTFPMLCRDPSFQKTSRSAGKNGTCLKRTMIEEWDINPWNKDKKTNQHQMKLKQQSNKGKATQKEDEDGSFREIRRDCGQPPGFLFQGLAHSYSCKALKAKALKAKAAGKLDFPQTRLKDIKFDPSKSSNMFFLFFLVGVGGGSMDFP